MIFELFHELVVTVDLQNVIQMRKFQTAEYLLGDLMNPHFLSLTFRRFSIETLEELTETNNMNQFVSNHIDTKGEQFNPLIPFYCRHYVLVLQTDFKVIIMPLP